jgi:predicted RNA binding protein YcfA (HicA-like mRNA interferase family)
MPKLPRISAAETVKAPQRLGFTIVRQRGSHIVMLRDEDGCVVPNHRDLKVGTLSGILKQANVSVDAFIQAL